MEREVCGETRLIDRPPLLDPSVRSLVAALDGCEIAGDRITWTASVHGVHADGHSWWIQVSRADDASASVVVRCSRFARAAHLMAVLRRWLPCSTHSLQVLYGMGRL